MTELDKVFLALFLIFVSLIGLYWIGLVHNQYNPKPSPPVRPVKGHAEKLAALKDPRKNVVRVGGGNHPLDGSGYRGE